MLLKAFEKQQEFRGAASYRTYLYRMTINRSYDYLRSWNYKNTVLTMKIQTIFQGASSAEKQAITNSEQQQIGHAVLVLPIKYREVIVLYYYKDMKVETIAEILNCSVNTVKTRLRRGREKLKYSLEGGGYDERFTN